MPPETPSPLVTPASHAAKCITFVSGKGGVGKTFLAANFAFCSALTAKTLLIDLDLQNQGLTGLLGNYIEPHSPGAYDYIVRGTPFPPSSSELSHISNNLLFLPASSSITDHQLFWNSTPSKKLITQVRDLINSIRLSDTSIKMIIIDCHGGLDDLSFGAFLAADVTLVVTESDKVTFNGTLELLTYYLQHYFSYERIESDNRRSCTPTNSVVDLAHADSSIVQKFQMNRIAFLVNRISAKLDYRIFLRDLKKEFIKNLPFLTPMISNIMFFPADSLAARSFSEYPFFVEIMPESIISQKLVILYKDVVGDNRTLIFSYWSRWHKLLRPNVEKKLREYVSSPDDDRAQAVFAGFGWAQLALVIMLFTLIVSIALGSSLYGDTRMGQKLAASIAGATISVLMASYITYLDFKVGKFYRDRVRYFHRLKTLQAKEIGVDRIGQLARIVRSLSLLILTIGSGVLVFAAGLLCAFVAIAIYLTD